MWGKANINTIKEMSKVLSDTLLEESNLFKNGSQKVIKAEVQHR
jgi:hypothetical protein